MAAGPRLENVMNPVGIMQGRLSPPTLGRIQSFPVGTWRDEFSLARDAGLDCIEWVYEFDTEVENPLRTAEGVADIRRLTEDTGVHVWSICADYYMTEVLVAQTGEPVEAVSEHLVQLMKRVASLGARYIVLPFVDHSSLQSPQELEGLVSLLRSVAPKAERAGLELHLETDLPARVLEPLLREAVSSRVVRITYDIGNEASAGHNPEEDLPMLRPWLGSVHIKDRLLGGGTVPLGTGAADFDMCFRMFAGFEYAGLFILQAARGDDEISAVRGYKEFLKPYFESYFGR